MRQGTRPSRLAGVAAEIGRSFGAAYTLEYLMAIMLQTGRPKDGTRLVQIIDQAKFDKVLLKKILKKQGLHHAWQTFCKKNDL